MQLMTHTHTHTCLKCVVCVLLRMAGHYGMMWHLWVRLEHCVKWFEKINLDEMNKSGQISSSEKKKNQRIQKHSERRVKTRCLLRLLQLSGIDQKINKIAKPRERWDQLWNVKERNAKIYILQLFESMESESNWGLALSWMINSKRAQL